MQTQTRITFVVENTANGPGLLAEHGLAVWIEIAGHRVLFDTGQTDVVAHNAERLGIPLSKAEAIVLSHGHYDHTGGLAVALDCATNARLLMHPEAMGPKFARNQDGTARYIGISQAHAQLVRDRHARVQWVDQPAEVVPGLFVTGPIPRTNGFEDVGGPFFTDASCTRPDPLWDDQALYFDTDQGLVVVVGCAHAGVVNTLHHIRQLTSNRPVRAVLGGLHLLQASSDRLSQTLETFETLAVQQLGAAHCTGIQAVTALRSRFPDRCLSCGAGAAWQF